MTVAVADIGGLHGGGVLSSFLSWTDQLAFFRLGMNEKGGN